MSHVFGSPDDADELAGDEPDEDLDLGPWSPRVDVVEDAGVTEVRADLPGIDPARDLKVKVADDQVTIIGERREDLSRQTGTLIHIERRYGRFERTISLPPGADSNKARAEYRDGVLKITIPTANGAGA